MSCLVKQRPPVRFCPYCGEGSIRFYGRVPRCTECKAVFFADFSRYCRKSPEKKEDE